MPKKTTSKKNRPTSPTTATTQEDLALMSATATRVAKILALASETEHSARCAVLVCSLLCEIDSGCPENCLPALFDLAEPLSHVAWTGFSVFQPSSTLDELSQRAWCAEQSAECLEIAFLCAQLGAQNLRRVEAKWNAAAAVGGAS